MNGYRKVEWKRNIRKVPSNVMATLLEHPEQEYVVGCVKTIERQDILNGVFDHLRLFFTGEDLLVIDQILPLAEMGKFSTRNREGWELIRKDLPKYFKSFSQEMPNFGDWSRGSHTVYQDREVYHRDYFDPLDIFIQVKHLSTSTPDRFVLKFLVGLRLDRNAPYFEDDLIFALNLLQENIGMAEVIPAEASDDQLLSTLDINWEIFPPNSEEEILRIIQNSRRNVSTDDLATVKERLAIFNSLNPLQLIRGRGGLNQYIGAKFADDLIVFENTRKGNALYILYEDWEAVSQYSRREILRSSNVKYLRIEHKEGWISKFKQVMGVELQMRGLGSDLFRAAS